MVDIRNIQKMIFAAPSVLLVLTCCLVHAECRDKCFDTDFVCGSRMKCHETNDSSAGYGCCYREGDKSLPCSTDADCTSFIKPACIESVCREAREPFRRCSSDTDCTQVGQCGGSCDLSRGVCLVNLCPPR